MGNSESVPVVATSTVPPAPPDSSPRRLPTITEEQKPTPVAQQNSSEDSLVVVENPQAAPNLKNNPTLEENQDPNASAGAPSSSLKPTDREHGFEVVDVEDSTAMATRGSPYDIDTDQAAGATVSREETMEEGESLNDITSDENEEDLEEDIDMAFVEQYDNTFNEFVAMHPQFLMRNPDLVHNLRVSKLQRLLEYHDRAEVEIQLQLDTLRDLKHEMETSYHHKLKEASAKKAAREIDLRSQLAQLQMRHRMQRGKLQWDLLAMSESRVKKQYKLRQELNNSIVPRTGLLELLPEHDPNVQLLKDAIQERGLYDEEAVRQYQVDNAFLNAEVNVLKKKLDYVKMAAKKFAWVETVLLRLDAKSMKKLRSRHEKKLGYS